jgi:hypothetical protein
MTASDQLYQFTLRSPNLWGQEEERTYIGARLDDSVASHVLGPGEIAITCDRPGVLPFRVLNRAHVTGVKKVVTLKQDMVTLKLDRASRPSSSGEPGRERGHGAPIASTPGVDLYLKPAEKKLGQAHDVTPAVKPQRAWKVPSKSNPDEKHLVTFTGRSYACDCKGFQYRSHCNHIITIVNLRNQGKIT